MNRLTVWNPFRRGELTVPTSWNDMMERFFSPGLVDPAEGRWPFKMDVKETAEAFEFIAELPGLAPEEVEVHVVGDTLTIAGEKKVEEKHEKDQWHVVERSYGSFQRSFTFPVPVEAGAVDAAIKDGVLTVKVPKSKKVVPKKVTIHAAK